MNKDRLYKAAFEFRKTKIWNKFNPAQVFAIRLSGGETGYVGFDGKGAPDPRINLYIGEKGYRSFLNFIIGMEDAKSYLLQLELTMHQDCLFTVFQNKEGIPEDIMNEARLYAFIEDHRFSGKSAYPLFFSSEAYYVPCGIYGGRAADVLSEAMEASVLMADLLKGASVKKLRITAVTRDTDKIPLFSAADGQLKQEGFVDVPKYTAPVYEPVPAENTGVIQKIKAIPKRGIWEAELLRALVPVPSRLKEEDYYPLMLVMVERTKDIVFPFPLSSDGPNENKILLERFENEIINQGYAPKDIKCRDERTYAFLKDLGEKTGMKVRLFNGKMQTLDRLEEDIIFDAQNGTGGIGIDQETGEMLEQLLRMRREEIAKFPKDFIDQLRVYMKAGLFPKEIASQLEEKLKGL